MPSVSDVIYPKFSHGAAFYTLSEKNINVKFTVRMNIITGAALSNQQNGGFIFKTQHKPIYCACYGVLYRDFGLIKLA